MIAADTDVVALLRRNPALKDDHLAGVIGANLINFEGKVEVERKSCDFATGRRIARVIYITPYSWKINDFLVSVRRYFIGVQFQQLSSGEDKVSLYVLGHLRERDPGYVETRAAVDAALSEGRRFTIAIAEDGSAMKLQFEPSQDGACQIL